VVWFFSTRGFYPRRGRRAFIPSMTANQTETLPVRTMESTGFPMAYL
jgi:hypothetical protein